MRFLLILCLLMFYPGLGVAQSQEKTFQQEIRFIQHMQSRGNSKETLWLLENIQPMGQAQKDSVNYYLGWVLYGLKDLEVSSWYLRQVSPESPFFHKSVFFAAYNLAYLAQFQKSLDLLQDLDLPTESTLFAMRNFQHSGLALLERDLPRFNALASDFSGNHSFMRVEEENLMNYAIRIQEAPSRSPLVAGLMSMAVPGLGKIYAGKTGEGISGFLYVGAMMVTSWDFFNRFGARNPFFIASAAVTGIFYIGNIWGSAAAVNRTKNVFNYEMDQRILLDMHVPLRRLFP